MKISQRSHIKGSGDQKKYHQYSLSFYHKEKQLSDISKGIRMQFENFQKHDKLLKQKTIDILPKFATEGKAIQKAYLIQDSEKVIDALFDVVKNFNSDRKMMQFILPTIDAILTEQKVVLRDLIQNIKTGQYPQIFMLLKSFLPIEDHRQSTYQAVARIISILYGQLPREKYLNDQKAFVLELIFMRKENRKQKVSDFCLLTCFAHLNKHAELVNVFLQNGGSTLITDTLTKTGNDIQLIYYVLLNVWQLTFVNNAIENFISHQKNKVIKLICDILQKVSRQKITRISFMIFKNLEQNHQCLELMIDNKLIKIIDTLLKGNIKDQDLIQKIKDTGIVLENNIRILSSFDKYVKEINSEFLEWSSVHTERFWKQNAIKFEMNDYQLIKHLGFLLNSQNTQNIAIACFDLGEFARFYPRGKVIIESNDIKDQIMEKARYSEDKNVRQQALTALQKIMIQNWQSI